MRLISWTLRSGSEQLETFENSPNLPFDPLLEGIDYPPEHLTEGIG
jgi:hypothetical protein